MIGDAPALPGAPLGAPRALTLLRLGSVRYASPHAVVLPARTFLTHPVPRLATVLAASSVVWFLAYRYRHWIRGPALEQVATALGARAARTNKESP